MNEQEFRQQLIANAVNGILSNPNTNPQELDVAVISQMAISIADEVIQKNKEKLGYNPVPVVGSFSFDNCC